MDFGWFCKYPLDRGNMNPIVKMLKKSTKQYVSADTKVFESDEKSYEGVIVSL